MEQMMMEFPALLVSPVINELSSNVEHPLTYSLLLSFVVLFRYLQSDDRLGYRNGLHPVPSWSVLQ